MTAQEHLTLRAGCGPLDGPGPESRDDHAEEEVWVIGYGLHGARVRRGDREATATGYGPMGARIGAYARLSREERAG